MLCHTRFLRGTSLICASSLLALAGLFAPSLAVKWMVIAIASAMHATGVVHLSKAASAAMQSPRVACDPGPPIQQELALH